MTKLVQIADDQGTDTDIIRLVGTGEDDLVPLFTYLISEDDNERFFLQVSSPNRNLSRFSPHPFDTIALSQMLALIENRGYEKDALVSHIRFYEAEIIAQIDENGKPKTSFTRPSTGAISRPAEAELIVDCLRLPMVPEAKSSKLRVGMLARSGDTIVPIFANENILNHHILVAGATGSGKSHLLANLAHVADTMDRCIILFDHKPDHQDHHCENPDAEIKRAFQLDENGTGGSGSVRYWTLDSDDPNKGAKLLGLPARELDPEILAGTIFHRASEENQAETFAAIASAFSETKEGTEWTIQELVNYVNTHNKATIEKSLFSDAEINLHQATLQAIKRKLRFGGSRIPKFIDPEPPMTALESPSAILGKLMTFFFPVLT